MSIETLIVAAIAVLVTIVATQILAKKKIHAITLEHIEEDDRTFHAAFDSGYAYGMIEGRKMEARERIIANMKKTQV